MQQISNFDEVMVALQTQFPASVLKKTGFTLDKMYELLKIIGNPQQQLKVIHVAGTSGKTSTCYYLAALLKAAGKKVGLTVSPHIDTINERVQINLEPLNEGAFCQYFSEFLSPEVTAAQPSYFEVMIAFAFWVFAKEQVDYAVIEVGLGGLADSTNVVSDPEKVCVITDIGYDHMRVLGDSLEEITAHKAGIIYPKNPVFMLDQDEAVVKLVTKTAQAKNATLAVVEPVSLDWQADLPPFAARDWQLAYETYQFLVTRDSLPVLSRQDQVSTAHIIVPARMEILKVGDKTVVLDGSHNQQKMAALVAGLVKRFPDQPMAALTSFVHTRSDLVGEAVAELAPLLRGVIITGYSQSQDFGHQSLEPAVVEAAFMKCGIKDITIVEDARQAFKTLLTRTEPVLVVTGSFFVLSPIRQLIAEELRHDS